MNVHEFAELSAGHALGALSADEERAFQEALAAHPEWSAILDADVETAAALADGAGAVEPPADIRAQLMIRVRASVAETRAVDTVPVEGATLGATPERADAEPADPAEALTPAEPVPAVPAEPVPAVPAEPVPAVPAEPVSAVPVAAESEPAVPEMPDESAAEAAARAEERAAGDPPTVLPEEAARRAAAPPTEVIQAIERRNWSRGLFALVASVALLVGIGWGVGYLADTVRTPPAVKTLAQIESAPDAREASGALGTEGTATLHWSDSVGEAVLVANGLPDVDDDRTFELWFVRGDGAVSAGTFDASSGDATALLSGDVEPGDVVAVTVEQRGGAPDGAPTTDPIVTIEAAEPTDESTE